MSLIAKYEKQPVDRKDYDIDYAEWLAWDPEDTLDDVVAAVTSLDATAGTGAPLVVERVDITATLAKLWVSGGVDGASYKIEVTATTQRGRVDQCEVKFKVRDY